MVSTEGALAPPLTGRRVAPVPFVIAILLVGVAAAIAFWAGTVGGQLVRVLSAGAATWLVVLALPGASERELRVRTWMSAALLVWTISELARLGALVGWTVPYLAELGVIGVAVTAAGAYVHAARGRMRSADETALYLDATGVFLAVATAVIVTGFALAPDSAALHIIIPAAFFGGMLGATLLLDVSTRAPVRWLGPWETLAGIAVGAAGYIGLLAPAFEQFWPVMHGTVGVGAVLVGHGGAHWTASEDHSRRYGIVTGWIRAFVPVGSSLLTGVLIVTLVTQPTFVEGPWRVAAAVALGLVIMCGIARQTLVLADRERVLRHERELTDELTVAEAQYRSVVERVPGVVYVAEPGQEGRWHFVSAKIEELLGYSPSEWTADPTMWIRSMHPADRDRMAMAEAGQRESLRGKDRWEYRLIARDGRVVWVIDDEAVIARDDHGHATMVQGILVDISDRRALEDQLRHQALHDPLTGLPNRVLFVDRLAHALVRRGPEERSAAVLFVDLDEFKAINDTLGHAAGDELLGLVAARLSSVLRLEDTACRLGGDEFAFLLERADSPHAHEVAERILEALSLPFEIGGAAVTLSASIGIAVRSGGADAASAASTADEVLREADTAMYASKSLGKGRVQQFRGGMEDPIARRRELSRALGDAIASDQLFLEYQPIVDMRDGSVFGVEALVRWNHPVLGRLMPNDFIGLAEDRELIGPLGNWVMRRAVADCADGTSVLTVNVSAHQLGSGQLSQLVADVLRTSGVDPARLVVELTESTLASAGAGAEHDLERVHDLGVRIALDDFGSGYSSLEYLGRLPIDMLKIDRSLVERVHEEPQRQEVLQAIEHIATKLGLDTIVEGVELEAQRQILLDLGFRHAQGFLFSPALPLHSALEPHDLPLAS